MCVLYKEKLQLHICIYKLCKKNIFLLLFLFLLFVNLTNYINYKISNQISIFTKLTKKSTLSLSTPFYNNITISPSLKKIDYEH